MQEEAIYQINHDQDINRLPCLDSMKERCNISPGHLALLYALSSCRPNLPEFRKQQVLLALSLSKIATSILHVIHYDKCSSFHFCAEIFTHDINFCPWLDIYTTRACATARYYLTVQGGNDDDQPCPKRSKDMKVFNGPILQCIQPA